VSLGYSQATHTIDFEPAGVGSGWSWTASDIAPGFAEITNPVSGGINTSATVVEFIAHTTDFNWALCHTDDNGEFTFDGTNSTVKIMVYKPTISNVAIKFEGASPAIEINVPNTVINQWEELTFDFSGQIGNTYNKIVVIPDFVTPYVDGTDRTTDNTLYFDNIQVPEGVIVETCSDGIMNQDETGIDCGGSICSACLVPPASAAPTPPNRAPADVVSVYSDAYTGNIAYDNFDAGWCGGASVTGVMISGNNTLQKNAGIDCQGIDFSSDRQDLSTFTHIHFDFYTNDTDLTGDVFNVKLVDFAGTGGEVTALEININTTTTPTIVANSWVSVDVDITTLGGVVSNNLTRSNVAQIGITTAFLTNVWYDNIYLYKGTPLGVDDVAQTSFKVYPNPTQDSWTVKTNNQEISSIQVFDMLGKNVLSLTPNANEAKIDGSILTRGIYFATITTDLGTSSKKLIKK
jgi:hypothetical protein